jgi:hypothetical protein
VVSADSGDVRRRTLPHVSANCFPPAFPLSILMWRARRRRRLCFVPDASKSCRWVGAIKFAPNPIATLAETSNGYSNFPAAEAGLRQPRSGSGPDLHFAASCPCRW